MDSQKVRNAADKAAAAIAARNEMIRAMHENGAPLREIGQAARMAHSAISRIVKVKA